LLTIQIQVVSGYVLLEASYLH